MAEISVRRRWVTKSIYKNSGPDFKALKLTPKLVEVYNLCQFLKSTKEDDYEFRC